MGSALSRVGELFERQRGLPEPPLEESERDLLDEEQRFTAILDELKEEFPECAKLALRELKVLAGARMRIPFESRAANGGSVRGWVEAYQMFREQLTKVIAINKGYRPAEDVERDRIFADYFRAYRHKYPAAMRLDETAVRAFAVCSTTLAIFIGKGLTGHEGCYDKALALYERSKAVVESLERGVVPNYQRMNKSLAELYGTYLGRPIDSNFVKQNMAAVGTAQQWLRRQTDEARRIGTITHEIHDEIGLKVDYSAVEKKMAEFYKTQLGEPFEPGPDLPKSDIMELDAMLKMANAKVEPEDRSHRKGTPIGELNKINKEPGAIIPCPECLKTPGKYVGFTVIEKCRRCDGSAKIANPDYVPAMLNPCSQIPLTARPSSRFKS